MASFWEDLSQSKKKHSEIKPPLSTLKNPPQFSGQTSQFIDKIIFSFFQVSFHKWQFWFKIFEAKRWSIHTLLKIELSRTFFFKLFWSEISLFRIYLDSSFLVTSLESSTKYRFDRKFYVSSVSRLAAIEYTSDVVLGKALKNVY